MYLASNGERFITAFNKIDQLLKKELQIQRHTPFVRMIDAARKKHPIVQKYELDLKKFAELRNVIVHERIAPNYIIAEPHDEIVAKIEHILGLLETPEKVFPRFQRYVKTFQYHVQLGKVLEVIKRHSYSQFPIYDGKQFIGLLTHNGISAWLANYNDNCMVSIHDIPISEVFVYETHKDNYMFISKNLLLYEAKNLFVTHFQRKMTRLDALLITNNGRKDEELLGIITPTDVLQID